MCIGIIIIVIIIDAAKRRQLPAWIREGLEKMEREKQRQLEKERQFQDAANAAKNLQENMTDREAMSEENAADDGGLTESVKSRFVRASLTHSVYPVYLFSVTASRLHAFTGCVFFESLTRSGQFQVVFLLFPEQNFLVF